MRNQLIPLANYLARYSENDTLQQITGSRLSSTLSPKYNCLATKARDRFERKSIQIAKSKYNMPHRRCMPSLSITEYSLQENLCLEIKFHVLHVYVMFYLF